MKTKELVSIEGDEIVIRVPILALPDAFKYCDYVEGFDPEGPRPCVTDAAVFARELLGELQREEEDGSTVVTEMLDDAMRAAVENGCEGVWLP